MVSTKTGKIFDFDFSRNGIKTEVAGRRRLALNDVDACLAAGLAGLGVMQIPNFMAQDHIASGELQIVLGEYLSENIPIYVLYPQNRYLSTKVRAFVDWTAELFANSDLIQARPTPTR